ncbi:MAG: type II toxin-antitoxin system RelE/ParE family toxin [Enterobacteriaceae bacterium]
MYPRTNYAVKAEASLVPKQKQPCREGVWELRIDQRPGYRVYYSLVNDEVVLLLVGGDKRNQPADINQAIECLQDYLKR